MDHFLPSHSYLRPYSEPLSPQLSRLSGPDNSTVQYVPKIIESGYIVGPPIAYTHQPGLPANFQPFTPTKQHEPTLTFSADPQFRPNAHSRITIQPSPPPPPNYQSLRPEETVPRTQYERCVGECRNWETKYNELHLKFLNLQSGHSSSEESLREENRRLRERVRELESRPQGQAELPNNVRDLVERYKESTLKQCYLLLDRYRLECRQNPR